MELNTVLLTCAGVLPAIALCMYVFKKDRVEKEPISLLLVLLALGACSCYPAARIEEVLMEVIHDLFAPYGTEQNGVLYLPQMVYKVYNAAQYFVGVALVEEAVKFAVLLLITRNNKNFNSLFDGLIYSVFVSLGFAALENVLYVTRLGWSNALMRAVMSVPAHMFFAVFMGYYYSLWHMYHKARQQERKLKQGGWIPRNAQEFQPGGYLFLSMLVPVLAHGLYDYCCTIGTNIGTVALYLFLLFMYIYCFGKIRKMSKGDMSDTHYSNIMVLRKYPHLAELVAQSVRKNDEPPAQTIVEE